MCIYSSANIQCIELIYFIQIRFTWLVKTAFCYVYRRFSGPVISWIVFCLHFKIEFRLCASGRQGSGIFYLHWRTASIKPKLLFCLCEQCFLRTFLLLRLKVFYFEKYTYWLDSNLRKQTFLQTEPYGYFPMFVLSWNNLA